MRKSLKPLQIRKVARVRDKATGNYFEIIEFPVSASERAQIELPPSVVVDTSALERRLRDAGAILPRHKTREILRAMAGRKAPVELVYEAQTGWTEDRKLFVLNDGAIGSTKQRIIGVNQGGAGDASGRLSVAGTWKAWRSTVGKATRSSSILICGVCTAFAAPLLSVVGSQSFTICIAGPSRSGKSITALVAASVIGIGKASDFITWNITDARLEQRLSGFNDSVFPIDDLMALRDQRDRDRYLRIQGIAYKLAQGWAAARHDSFSQSRGGHAGWRTIALTSNEISIRDLARKAGMERQRGESIRLIDLPALDEGVDHIFDRLPKRVLGGSIIDWKREQFGKIADACEQNHGAVYRRYIASLIAKGPRLAPFIHRQINSFIKCVADEQDSDLARDIAKRFALLYAGGVLAQRAGLVAWDDAELFDAIRKCYRKARSMLPDDGELLRNGLALLERKLRSFQSSDSVSANGGTGLGLDAMDGIRLSEEHPRVWLIKRHAFDAVFVSTHQREIVEAWLLEQGQLTKALSKRPTSKPAAKEQFIWPDGVRRRSVRMKRASA